MKVSDEEKVSGEDARMSGGQLANQSNDQTKNEYYEDLPIGIIVFCRRCDAATLLYFPS